MREPMHPVTQRFRDPAVEEAYLDHSAASSVRLCRIATVPLVLGVLAAYASDDTMFGSERNVAVVHRVRELWMFPVVAIATLGAFAPPRWFRAWWRQFIVVTTITLICAPAAACLLLPEPARFDVAAGYISVVAVMVAAAVVLPIGFLYATFATAVSVSLMVIVSVIWPTYDGDAGAWILFAGFIAVFGAYQVNLRDRVAFAAQYRLDEERARSERLLRNVLPAPVAERLKAGEARIADRFDDATVLFADLVGFTTLAARMPPEKLVAALDEVFSAFDDIAARHDLEKIKTIGDAYMVVGGVPAPRGDHAVAVARMALEMRAVIDAKRFDGEKLELRIGLHSGPLVAGVIGKQKFIYDLWGDTVNTASRMESSGVPSGIQVTAATEALLRGRFTLEPRGKVSVKGKGDLDTWMLVGL